MDFMHATSLNQGGPPNRRHASPLGAVLQFGRARHAPSGSAAVVAEFVGWRRYALVKNLIITLLFIGLLASCAHVNDQPPARVATPTSPFYPLTITIFETNPVVWVVGEVRQPGRIIWNSRLTLTNAIASAGGFTDFANAARLEIRRSDGSVERYSYYRVVKQMTNNPSLRPNDFVQVERRIL
jgi:hypothetical protein